MKTLKEVKKFLDSIDNINAGGCGISALAIIRWLKRKKKKASVYFAYCDYGSFRMDSNLSRLKRNSTVLEAPSHCIVKYNTKYMDSTGILNKNTDPSSLLALKLKHKIPNEQVLIDTINKGEWNYCFDRRVVPSIAKKLNINLSDII